LGIEPDTLRFLLDARRSGVDFTSTLCIGRQYLFMSPDQLAQAFADFGERVPVEELGDAFCGTADRILRRLGAESIDALDASPYEGANLIADLNEPLDPTLEGNYSAVLDLGTREHVFDAVTGLRNCMRTVALGGHLLVVNPLDGYVGHGFYQFAPEFFYRTLDSRSGFAVERMLASDRRRWWEVADPSALGRRVETKFSRPTALHVRARRLEQLEPLRELPQQSDYVRAWKGRATAPEPNFPGPLVRRWRAPMQAITRLKLSLQGLSSTDRDAFRRVKL
jgi:hypothetical protein